MAGIIDGGSKRVQRSEYRCDQRQKSWLGQRQLGQAQSVMGSCCRSTLTGRTAALRRFDRTYSSAQLRVLALMGDISVVQLMERGHARDARRSPARFQSGFRLTRRSLARTAVAVSLWQSGCGPDRSACDDRSGPFTLLTPQVSVSQTRRSSRRRSVVID